MGAWGDWNWIGRLKECKMEREKKEIKEVFAEAARITDGPLINNLKGAWREAEAYRQRHLSKSTQSLPEAALDDPLHHEVQSSLQSLWRTAYHFDIPASWRGPRVWLDLPCRSR